MSISILGRISENNLHNAAARPYNDGSDAEPGTRNTFDRMADEAQRAVNGQLDGPATTISLLDELKKSDNPALAQIGNETQMLFDRLGGNLDDKWKQTLQNLVQRLEVEGADPDRSAGNDDSCDSSQATDSGGGCNQRNDCGDSGYRSDGAQGNGYGDYGCHGGRSHHSHEHAEHWHRGY